MKNTMRSLVAMLSIAALGVACSGCGDGTPTTPSKKGGRTGGRPTKEESPDAKGSDAAAPSNNGSSSGGYSTVEVKDGGTLKGAITWAGDVPADQLTYDYTASKDDAEVCAGGGMTEGGKRKNLRLLLGDRDGGKKGVADVVVWIEATQGAEFKPAAEATLDNKNCEFHPLVQLLGPKTKLVIKNSDTTTHNTKAKYKAWGGEEEQRLNENLKGGSTANYTEGFDGAGQVTFVCDQHYWMEAFAVVQNHPYYAVTDAKGNFEISTPIPAGKYKVSFWHAGYALRRDNDGKMKGYEAKKTMWHKADVEIKAGANDLGDVEYGK